MSRTRKDRPYWVRANDPTSARRASHKHLITCIEKIGEEVVTRNGWNFKLDRWENDVPWYTRGIYRRWTEQVPCTLDIPEKTPSTWRWHGNSRPYDNDRERNDKHCNYWLQYDGDYRSGKDWKHLTNSAVRGKVKEQLNAAVRDYGSYWEDGDWDDVDVFVDSKHAGNGWYDW